MRLILASSSPRRAEILRQAQIPFDVVAPHVDEAAHDGEGPVEMVRRLAEAKARAAASQIRDPAIVVGADTTVVLEGKVYAKPESAEHAAQMFRHYSGRTHEVLTGVAVLRLPDGLLCVEHETTRVTFAAMSEIEIADYIASGEPFDKAGAYAIQGRGGRYVTRIEGCYFNVMGLPLARLYEILREMGWKTAS
jgi:septum formation protein